MKNNDQIFEELVKKLSKIQETLTEARESIDRFHSSTHDHLVEISNELKEAKKTLQEI